MKRLLGLVAAALMALVAAGCTTSTTLVRRDQGEGQVIYRISEEKAFTVALDTYAVLLPKQRVDDIVDGLRRGYNADERWGLDYWSHRMFVIPAVGTDTSGSEVHGYWFDISGSGSMLIIGSIKSTELLTRILEALDATGTATVVTNLREGRYETDGRAYRAGGRDGRDVRASPRSSGTGDADRLSELKSMRDKGLITGQEYEAKRRQILDRM